MTDKTCTWLKILKDDMWQITEKIALLYWQPFPGCSTPYFNYRFEHVKHVEKIAMKLFAKYGGDEDIILAAVWTHDRTKFEEGNHAKTGSEWILQNLAQTGFPEHKVKDVAYAISMHNGWEPREIKTIEGKILYDADKLSKFGPAAFLDTIFRNTSKKICERDAEWKNNAMQFHETISMGNFLDRLSGFKNVDHSGYDKTFNFEESLKLLDKYTHATKAFFEALEEQLT